MNQATQNKRRPLWMTTLCALWLVQGAMWGAFAQTPEQLANPFTGDEDAIAEGQLFFRAFCWGCHGRTAREGTRAPDLLQPQWLYGWSEAGVFKTIYDGIPNTGMRNFGGKLTNEEIWKVISYVRMQQAKAAGVTLASGVKTARAFVPYMKGDARAGETLFFSEEMACGKCHTARGKGGYGTGNETGPDMTHIARTRSPQFIIESILNPRAYIDPKYKNITIITKDGKEITGRKRPVFDKEGEEDKEVVQVLDESGMLWTTYFTKDIKESFTPPTSVMPENFADILTVKQLHDIYAYLLTLK